MSKAKDIKLTKVQLSGHIDIAKDTLTTPSGVKYKWSDVKEQINHQMAHGKLTVFLDAPTEPGNVYLTKHVAVVMAWGHNVEEGELFLYLRQTRDNFIAVLPTYICMFGFGRMGEDNIVTDYTLQGLYYPINMGSIPKANNKQQIDYLFKELDGAMKKYNLHG